MVKTTLFLDEETALTLSELARARATSPEQIVQDALAAFTPKVPRPAITGIGAYHSGRSDVSERAEELLREAARQRR
jgi:hypothetical protein